MNLGILKNEIERLKYLNAQREKMFKVVRSVEDPWSMTYAKARIVPIYV